MSVRHGLLALLAERPAGAYQLRQEFERRTGGTWPLNMGQVSTTLDRLVRDGLVEPADADGDVPRWTLSPAGHDTLRDWWAAPVARTAPARDELAIKLALAVSTPGVDVRRLVQVQRTETMRAMQALHRLRVEGAAAADADLAWSLVVDHLVFAAEAEIRWLDHVEARVARAAATRDARPPASTPRPAPAPADDETAARR